MTTYAYLADDALLQTAYTNTTIATPAVSFTYDSAYPRVATMVDGTGTTSYNYYANTSGQLGAGQISAVDGPLTNDTITYVYDELGRVTSRAINAVTETTSYDALGRVTAQTNVLGTFAYTYVGNTGRLAAATYPNGQTSTYSYFGHMGDDRLQTIHHRYPNANTLSKFDYTYDAAGNILTWQQQADANAPTVFKYGYDTADELTAATKWTTDAMPVVLKRYAYAYDKAGNRTSEQVDDAVTGATNDAMNRLGSLQPAGGLLFAGTVSEPATVTVAGKPATVNPDNSFSATVPVASGTNTVPIVATDASGNSATRSYQVSSGGSTTAFTYDANGNVLSDGTRTFEWDARNELVAVTIGTHRSEFGYDGLQRRVQVVEKENGVLQSQTRLLWCDETICEERASDGVTVNRRAFDLGEQVSGTARLFATDHLGSVTDVTDNTGLLLARYTFDPWGRRTLTGGSDLTDVAFTQYTIHRASGTYLSLFRAYDPGMARWISEDPIRLQGGINLYAYVNNSVTTSVDDYGLVKIAPWSRRRTRGCRPDEMQRCTATCANQGKGVESCRVPQLFRVTRATPDAAKWEWVDGPMSCSCTDPKKPAPSCQNCTKVLIVVGILGRAIWTCLSNLPELPPEPVLVP